MSKAAENLENWIFTISVEDLKKLGGDKEGIVKVLLEGKYIYWSMLSRALKNEYMKRLGLTQKDFDKELKNVN